MSIRRYIPLALCATCLLCQSPNTVSLTVDNDHPGCFSLTRLQGLQRSLIPTTTDTATIGLGDLHSTTNYYFLLTNSGGHCITDVNLSVSDSSFLISPSTIDSLHDATGTQNLVPIVKLTALHGIGAQGIGTEPLMSPGIHRAGIIITGKTIHNDNDTDISLIAIATVKALVLDVDAHTSTMVVDFASPWNSMNMYSGNTPLDIKVYTTSGPEDSIATIVNVGNVNLRMTTIARTPTPSGLDSAFYGLNVADSIVVVIPQGLYLIIRLDGDNTLSNPDKFPLQPDGNVYFSLLRGTLTDG